MTNHCGHCDRVHEGYRHCSEEWCTGCFPDQRDRDWRRA